MRILELNWSNIIMALWDFIMSIINFTGSAWTWLSTPFELGVMEVTPLGIFGGGLILTLLVMFMVKTFVPFL